MTLPTLPPLDASDRGRQLRQALDRDGHRSMVVTNLSNIHWLTGFTGSSAWVVSAGERLHLVTDGRYADRAAAECAAVGADVDLVIGATQSELRERVVDLCRGRESVAAEAHHLTHAQWSDLEKEVELVPAGSVVETLRRVKTDPEIVRIATAAEIATAALADVAPMLAEEPTEADVRDELDYRMRRLGAAGPSYDTIVASGPEHAARPHHEPGQRTIREGDTVVIDVGALVDGYHSDMTRSFVVGEPTGEQRHHYEAVLRCQVAGLDAVKPGAKTVEIDGVCRQALAADGLDDWFVHGTGHGVGLDIHEAPWLMKTATDELVVGDVVTVEPGVYRAGFGGIRIEDLVTVTADGYRQLTTFAKDDPCLPSPPTI